MENPTTWKTTHKLIQQALDNSYRAGPADLFSDVAAGTIAYQLRKAKVFNPVKDVEQMREQLIATIDQYQKDLRQGVVGLSLTATLYNYLIDKEFIKENK